MVATTRRMAQAAGRNNNTDNIGKPPPNSTVNGKASEPKILRSTHKKTIAKKVVLKVRIAPKKADNGKANVMTVPKKADEKNKGNVKAKMTTAGLARPTVTSHKAAGVHVNQHQLGRKKNPTASDASAGANNARKTRNTRSAAAERTKQLQREYLLSVTFKPPQTAASYADGKSTSVKIEKPSEHASNSNLSHIKAAATKELETHDTATRLESSLDIGPVFTKRPDLKKTKPKEQSTDAQPGRYIVTGLRQCHIRTTTTSKAAETDAIVSTNANISDERKQTDKTVPAPDLTNPAATPPTTPTPICPKPKKSWAARAVAHEDVTNPGENREIHRQLFTDEDTATSSDVPDINFINAPSDALDLRTTKALALIDSVEDELEPAADHNQPFYEDGPFAEFNESDPFGGRRNTNQAIENQLVEVEEDDDIREIRVVPQWPQPPVLGHSSETEHRRIPQDKLHQHGRQRIFNGPAQPAQSSGLSLYSPQPQPPQIFPSKLYRHRFVTFFECPKCCRQFKDMLETQIHFAMCEK